MDIVKANGRKKKTKKGKNLGIVPSEICEDLLSVFKQSASWAKSNVLT